MAWDQLWIDKPHLAYALIGGFTTIFSLISLFVKEKLYIGEATVATIFGVIVGPHCLNWFSPQTWGNTDFITLEVSRIVLIVQIFAVAVELPKKYMLKHWLPVTILLLPVMIFGWLISSVFIWKLVPSLSWIEGLTIAACVTATDPVLASAVVGKGKFAKRVPGHLRNLLSAESGCNDGMAFPFAYLAINCIKYAGDHGQIAFHFIVITVLYECVFGCVLGTAIGLAGKYLIKFAEKHNLIDRESFLSFYFVLALFCTGVGTIIGTDDLLVAFAAGTAFSWDGWFTRKTEESHVSNVIDLLLNMSFFVYFGAIVPWELFNSSELGIQAWKLVILAILILLFRRIPIMLAMKPLNSDIRTWREALFCGHFGPIGVGAIFICILCRAELESGEPTPLAHLPPKDSEHYAAIAAIWPVTTFLVIASIVVHGSSVAVFTLGKRLNNMTITMSYTTGGNNQSWLSRLPRLEGGKTLSLQKVDTQEPNRFRVGTTAKPAGGMRKRRGKSGEHIPANYPIDLSAGSNVPERSQDVDEGALEEEINVGPQAFQEGNKIIIEDPEGEVIRTVDSRKIQDPEQHISEPSDDDYEQQQGRQASSSKEKTTQKSSSDSSADADNQQSTSRGGDRPLRREDVGRKIVAYQLDNTIIVENEDGEIVRRYRINRPTNQQQKAGAGGDQPGVGNNGIFNQALSWVGIKKTQSNTSYNPNNTASGPNSPQQQQEQQQNTSPDDNNTATDSSRIDLEKQGDTQKQDDDNELELIDANNTDLHVDDNVMKRHLKSLLLDTEAGGHGYQQEDYMEGPSSGVKSSPNTRVPRNFLGRNKNNYDDEEEEEDDDDNEIQGDDSDEPETAVERQRRLAALGLVRNEDDEDDEEEGTAKIPQGSNRPGPPPIQEEEEDGEPKIQWSSDVKRSN